MPDKARECALFALRRVWDGGAFSNIETSAAADRYGLRGTDRAFCFSLVNTALERVYTLDFLIERASGRRVGDIDGALLPVLRLGFAQLFYMRVPDAAACDESASLVGDAVRRGFVNAVMRNACRGRRELEKSLEGAADSAVFSLSTEICALIRLQYPENADAVMRSFFDRNALCLRVNTLKTTPEQLAKELQTEGAEAEARGVAVLVRKNAAAALAAVRAGKAFVQGLSSQRAAAELRAAEGQTLVDVCACPGGKSFYAALDMENRGRVVCMDIHANKLSLVKRGASALGLGIVEVCAHDGRTAMPELQGCADRVICDVPCSGIGAIKGRPEIRRKDLSGIGRLVETQRAILKASWSYLKSGGLLLYSTCTLNKDENEGVLRPFAAGVGAETVSERTTLPTERDCDGFYAAVLKKL